MFDAAFGYVERSDAQWRHALQQRLNESIEAQIFGIGGVATASLEVNDYLACPHPGILSDNGFGSSQSQVVLSAEHEGALT